MKNKITAFYVENFKAIENGTWFDINDITIITGANNSGKSTLFKAMNIFANGFINGDFPLIDIQKVLPGNGYFKDICTRNSSKHYFKVGYRYYSERFQKTFEIIYQFVKGDTSQYAQFASMTVLLNKKETLSLYAPIIYDDPITVMDSYGRQSTFTSVLEDSNPGEIMFKVNLPILKLIHDPHHVSNFSALFDRMNFDFHEFWHGEGLSEQDVFDSNSVHYKRIASDLYADLMDDYFKNFYNFEHKFPIFNDSDAEEILSNYRFDIDKYKYRDFLRTFIKPLLEEISLSLKFFYSKQLLHINLTNSFYERVITSSDIDFKLPILDTTKVKKPSKIESIFEISANTYVVPLFIKHSLKIMGINGNIITNEIDNHSYQVFYLTPEGVKYNIADLGKGQAQIIQLLLAIGSMLIEGEITGNPSLNSNQFIKQTILHLEEPEIFLHPKWQSKLADILTLIAKTDFKLIIETHSEYLIRKLQYIIANGTFEHENISIYYFEDSETKKEKANTQLYRSIKLDKHGRMSQDFGPGFFDEADNIAIQLFNLNQQSQN